MWLEVVFVTACSLVCCNMFGRNKLLLNGGDAIYLRPVASNEFHCKDCLFVQSSYIRLKGEKKKLESIVSDRPALQSHTHTLSESHQIRQTYSTESCPYIVRKPLDQIRQTRSTQSCPCIVRKPSDQMRQTSLQSHVHTLSESLVVVHFFIAHRQKDTGCIVAVMCLLA